MKLRERFWLWGHPEGAYNGSWGNPGLSRMTPTEFCMNYGIPNTFFTPAGPKPCIRRLYNKSFKPLKQVGWECFRAGKDPKWIENIIQDAKEFTNISCVVFDDFFMEGRNQDVPMDNLWKIKERLHNNEVKPLDMWIVIYTWEYGVDAKQDAITKKYLEPFDGVMMWTWNEDEVPLIPEKFEKLKGIAPDKRYLFGCYLYNFGREKQATGEAVKWQLDWYREKILAGEAEGVILHTNTMADLDYPAYEVAYKWMEEHGDEEVPDLV